MIKIFGREIERKDLLKGALLVEVSIIDGRERSAFWQGTALFDCDVSAYLDRFEELEISNFLSENQESYEFYSEIESGIVKALGATKAEIETFNMLNNEAWFLVNFSRYWLSIKVSDREQDPDGFDAIVFHAIGLGRLIEWWRWRTSHEKVAVTTYDRKAASNKGSAKASQNKKAQRIEAMLSEMEKIVNANPDASRFGVDVIAKLAIENAAKNDGQLWSQGKNQRDNYLSEMRSNSDLTVRYYKIFPKTP